MGVFVDQAGLDHQEEAGFVLRQDCERGLDLRGQVGLLGEFFDAAALEELAVERAVHVAGRE